MPSSSVGAEGTQQMAVTLCDPDLELQKLLTKLQQETLTDAVKEPSQGMCNVMCNVKWLQKNATLM